MNFFNQWIENGIIYLDSEFVEIDSKGVITYNGRMIDTLRVDNVKDKKKLHSFNHKIFYFDHEEMVNHTNVVEGDYTLKQGYYEDSSVTKAYIGLVPEWENGHQANVKMVKAYIKNMQTSLQVANPQ